ncbi:MAG: SAM-dependent methyltransferase [Rhodobiaceae bacterium]|nr:SAM-dependent methyltransferase [Rhodobiaceae bacterium]
MTDIPKGFSPKPYPYHHELNLEIDSLSNLGLGIGREKGWVIQVPFVLPGEIVRVRIFRNHKNYSSADCIEILEQSASRTNPVCEIFGECGGCQYQHANYDFQLKWKTQQVKELFSRIGGMDLEVKMALGSPIQYGYRSKLTPHYEKWHSGRKFQIGFLKSGTRRKLVDVESCPIATPSINKAIPTVRKMLLEKAPTLKKGGTLLFRDTEEGVVQEPSALVEERVGNLIFQFRAGEFFQNNPFILPKLVDHVIHEAQGDIESKYLIDAYCGSGLFGLSGASYFQKVTGVEISQKSFLGAQANAKLNMITNAEFILGDASSIFEHLDHALRPCSLIIDPPRKGCDAGFLDQTLSFAPDYIIYVSCDPSTQARDAKTLCLGGYRIENVQPFDLFPHTRHIENVVTFKKDC